MAANRCRNCGHALTKDSKRHKGTAVGHDAYCKCTNPEPELEE